MALPSKPGSCVCQSADSTTLLLGVPLHAAESLSRHCEQHASASTFYGWLAADHVPNVFTVVLVYERLKLHVMVPGVLHGLETRDRADVADVPRGAMHNSCMGSRSARLREYHTDLQLRANLDVA